MRNLKTIAIEDNKLPSTLPLSATAWDAANNSVICAFGPTNANPVIELRRKASGSSDFISVTSWDAPCPLPDLECDDVLLLRYFSNTSTSCLVLAGGDIVVVRDAPSPDQERIEIVGSVDTGISAAAWAPDEELLAIVTRGDSLVLMSRNFELVTETALTADDLKASKHVSVGWGKKETQFQGKRAKAMRDPTMPETVDEGRPSPHENSEVLISWRGDGAYFAVNSIVPNHRRVIRVFSREAVLDSASEPVDGLENALSWRPAGNLLAGIKRSAEKLEVVFFERNGLRHGQFELRVSQEEMEDWARSVSLVWNIDSSILAVKFTDRLQLWTVGNYHYYLKQEIPLRPPSLRSRYEAVQWHPETPLRLTCTSGDALLDLTYLSTVSRGSTIPPFDYGVVAVVDGRTLRLTPLKQAGVPPPMSFCDVTFDYSIVDCVVSHEGGRIIVLTTDTLELCRWEMRRIREDSSKSQALLAEKRYTTAITRQSLPLPSAERIEATRQRYSQVELRDETMVFLLAPGQQDTSAHMTKILWPAEGPLGSVREVKVPATTQNIFSDSRQKSIWLSRSEDTIRLVDKDHPNSISFSFDFRDGQPDSDIFTTKPDSTSDLHHHNENIFHKVSLDPTGILKVDDRVLSRDCTSFVVTDAHLLFTTTQHLLKFVHLTESSKMEVPGNTPEIDERCRSIERNARIVTVIPSAYAVVLQMPRGNLETIYPRVLVLAGIRHHLQSLEYWKAFLACQTNQVDMNILHDYQPEQFIANVPRFIDELKKPSKIDEFLSKLKDEDVSQTLYRDTLKDPPAFDEPLTGGVPPTTSSKSSQATSKVNRICEAFLTSLASRSSSHLQNIVTAHVCKRPPDLPAALTLVSSLRGGSQEEADLAVSHLCFLTDTNRLYDAALALYDLDLTLLVAQNAQRDPREYMPFLQSLHALPVLRKQFTIDNHLRNYAKALTSLHLLEAHDELEAYTIKHTLYTQAMQLYRYDQPHLSKMTRIYADHLSTQSKHSRAATLYESLGDYTSAYPLYSLAHQWRESLACACLVPLDTSQLQTLATSLATTCADETRDYRAAATIHAEYLHDLPSAARLLCKGSYFAEAIRLLALHNLKSDIPSIVDASLNDKFSEILELVADCKSQLAAQIPRIIELRHKKSENPLAFYGGDAALMNTDGVDIPDSISLADTDASTFGGQSLFTRYGSYASKFGGTVASNVSRKTSKTKRREERKRASGKKGSVYEEEYLVGSVARLIERVNGVHEEVGRLMEGLLRRGMREQAAREDEVMREIGKLCEGAKGTVWGETVIEDVVGVEAGGYDGNVGGRPSGADGVLWDSQIEMGMRGKEAPTVQSWVQHDLVSF